MTRKTHDAELCERIRQLEERVAELEAAPRVTHVPAWPHYCWSGCPEHYPTITWRSNDSSWSPPPGTTITCSTGTGSGVLT